MKKSLVIVSVLALVLVLIVGATQANASTIKSNDSLINESVSAPMKAVENAPIEAVAEAPVEIAAAPANIPATQISDRVIGMSTSSFDNALIDTATFTESQTIALFNSLSWDADGYSANRDTHYSFAYDGAGAIFGFAHSDDGTDYRYEFYLTGQYDYECGEIIYGKCVDSEGVTTKYSKAAAVDFINGLELEIQGSSADNNTCYLFQHFSGENTIYGNAIDSNGICHEYQFHLYNPIG